MGIKRGLGEMVDFKAGQWTAEATEGRLLLQISVNGQPFMEIPWPVTQCTA
jgi:hypothetical protein